MPPIGLRGYQALCVNNSTSKSGASNDGVIDQVLLELKAAMQALRAQPGVRRVVLLGHSGGGTITSAYQMIAEGGVKACQGAEKIWACPDTLAGLPRRWADAGGSELGAGGHDAVQPRPGGG
jgi:enoyl-CoA hydratase/carnithine racemase